MLFVQHLAIGLEPLLDSEVEKGAGVATAAESTTGRMLCALQLVQSTCTIS